jgi:hypothetical protein
MAVNPLSASVSRAAGIRAKLSYSCSTCDLLLFDFHQDRNILKLKYNIFYPNTLYWVTVVHCVSDSVPTLKCYEAYRTVLLELNSFRDDWFLCSDILYLVSILGDQQNGLTLLSIPQTRQPVWQLHHTSFSTTRFNFTLDASVIHICKRKH